MKVEQQTLKCNIIQWSSLPDDVKKSVMYFNGFTDNSDCILSGSEFDAWDVGQTYKDTLSMKILKQAHKDYVVSQFETTLKDYNFDAFVEDFNLQVYVWLAKNSRTIDLNVNRIIIHVDFHGFASLLK
jgi:hypothetical protein